MSMQQCLIFHGCSGTFRNQVTEDLGDVIPAAAAPLLLALWAFA